MPTNLQRSPITLWVDLQVVDPLRSDKYICHMFYATAAPRRSLESPLVRELNSAIFFLLNNIIIIIKYNIYIAP